MLSPRGSGCAPGGTLFCSVGRCLSQCSSRWVAPCLTGQDGETFYGSVADISAYRAEIADLLERRHTVLQSVYYLQPIGRRALAARLDWRSGWCARKSISWQAGLIDASGGGMESDARGKTGLGRIAGCDQGPARPFRARRRTRPPASPPARHRRPRRLRQRRDG